LKYGTRANDCLDAHTSSREQRQRAEAKPKIDFSRYTLEEREIIEHMLRTRPDLDPTPLAIALWLEQAWTIGELSSLPSLRQGEWEYLAWLYDNIRATNKKKAASKKASPELDRSRYSPEEWKFIRWVMEGEPKPANPWPETVERWLENGRLYGVLEDWLENGLLLSALTTTSPDRRSRIARKAGFRLSYPQSQSLKSISRATPRSNGSTSCG
jgi:hypothetical protein